MECKIALQIKDMWHELEVEEAFELYKKLSAIFLRSQLPYFYDQLSAEQSAEGMDRETLIDRLRKGEVNAEHKRN